MKKISLIVFVMAFLLTLSSTTTYAQSKAQQNNPLPIRVAYLQCNDKEYSDVVPLPVIAKPEAKLVVQSCDGETYIVTSFRAIINGTWSVNESGNRFSDEQIEQIKKSRKGAFIIIRDIRAIGPDGIMVRVNSLTLQIQ